MRVHLIRKETIEAYAKKHATSRPPFRDWLAKIRWADWHRPGDVKATFGSADLIEGDRVVFNIGGNNYRMIAYYHFGKSRAHLFVKWIGTHAEYTALCHRGDQYTVDMYK